MEKTAFLSEMSMLLLAIVLVGGLHLLSLWLLRAVRGECLLTARDKQRWRVAGWVMLLFFAAYVAFLVYLKGVTVNHAVSAVNGTRTSAGGRSCVG